jgi:hypothetical protein
MGVAREVSSQLVKGTLSSKGASERKSCHRAKLRKSLRETRRGLKVLQKFDYWIKMGCPGRNRRAQSSQKLKRGRSK